LLITYHQEFMGDRPNNLRIDELMMELTGSNDKNCLDRVNDFSKHLPFLLEESNDKNNGFINFDQAYNLMPYYKDIFIDIVCETYHKGETFFPTEKIGRCLASKTPFLVYAGKNYLKNLQQLGFHTFSNFFNEDYDYYEGRLRLFEMSKIINDLARKKLDELKIIYHNMNEVLEHNYQIYKSLDKKKFLDIFNNV
jgi:hypothetical protein